ncbi:MFS transporter [Acidimangrovimonas sediminis]|uniref:MFS transporter n=1 Tax=Acidimangrovimonas sediminis TaxID=2056283 RepID=UPI000C802848|nr:MFS transporter [Acidimangrovimonas sediminis]
MASPWLTLVITLAIQAMISAAALAGPVLAPEVAAAAGVPATLVGIQVGLIYAAAAVASLASGGMIQRHGAVRVSQGALVLAAGGLAVSLAGAAAAIAAGALLIGLGYGVVTPASSHLLAQTTPRHRMGLVFSIKQTGVPVGGMLAGLVLPHITLAAGWRSAVALCIVLCLGIALVAQTVRRPLDADRIPGRAGGGAARMLSALRYVFAEPSMRALALTSFVFAAMQLVLSGYLVTFLTEGRGLPLATAGTILAVAQAAGVGGRLLWGWSADHLLNARHVLALLAFVSAICAAFFALQASLGTPLTLGAIAALFGAAAIGWNGVFLAEVARIAPREHVASATGASLFMTYAGVVFGPPAFAAIVSLASYGLAFAVASFVMAAMGVYLAVSGPRRPALKSGRCQS